MHNMLPFQKAGTDLKKSEDKLDFLKKRGRGVRFRLRFSNSAIQRDIEARKREEDNKIQSRNKDHKRVMDKDEQHHKQELACINETISEKCEEIKCLNEILNLKEAHIAKTKLDQTKEMEDMAEAMSGAHCKKTAKLALNQYDEMQKKDVEIKDLQERLSSLELNLDSAKTDNMNKLEKQQKQNKKYYCDMIEAEKKSLFRKHMEDLVIEIKMNQQENLQCAKVALLVIACLSLTLLVFACLFSFLVFALAVLYWSLPDLIELYWPYLTLLGLTWTYWTFQDLTETEQQRWSAVAEISHKQEVDNSAAAFSKMCQLVSHTVNSI